MKLLLIAGMGESVKLAGELAGDGGHQVVCIREGRAVARAAPPAITYEGDAFETDQAFTQFVAQEDFDMIIDAAHPFQFHHGRMAQKLPLPYLRVTRPLWQPQGEERWINAPSLQAGVTMIAQGARVFLATGRGSLHCFEHRPDLEIFCRQLAPHSHAFPLPKGRFVFGAGPFSVEQEVALFQLLGINTLMLRNTGSIQGRSKVDAAGHLGLDIIMIAPPRTQLPPSQQAGFDEVAERVAAYAPH